MPGVAAVAENVGKRSDVRPFVFIVGAQRFVRDRVRIARAFDGDFRILGSAIPPTVIIAQHGRIDHHIAAVDPLDRIAERYEIAGCGVIHIGFVAQFVAQWIAVFMDIRLGGPEYDPLLAIWIPVRFRRPCHARARNL